MYSDKLFTNHVDNIINTLHLNVLTQSFSISGSLIYSRYFTRDSFIYVGIGTRGGGHAFLTDPKGIQSTFAATALPIMVGKNLFENSFFALRGSIGALLSFVYIDPVSDPNLAQGAIEAAKAGDPFLSKISITYTLGAGLGIGLDFIFKINENNSISISGKASIGPDLLYYNNIYGLAYSSYTSAEVLHSIAISKEVDFYYRVGLGYMYIDTITGQFYLTYFADSFVYLNAGVSYKF